MSPAVDVSIVLPTRDRPAQLERCLAALVRQRAERSFEVIVVDNAPESGSAREVVERVGPPGRSSRVRLIEEPRRGLSVARNAGILRADGEIVVCTDDDTEATPGWLDGLTRPFSRPEVAAVTGNTLPYKVETEAERLFEAYGGLGRGEVPREFGPRWLKERTWRLPLWEIGSTANAAFRAGVFRDPAIGLMEERLGAGSPAGAWEDLLCFYLILRSGQVIVYEPRAVTRHAHRERLSELGSQLQAYRRGEVACALLLLGEHHEWRAVPHTLLWIPYWRASQLAGEILRRVSGRRRFDLSIVLREWRGYAEGPFALRRFP